MKSSVPAKSVASVDSTSTCPERRFRVNALNPLRILHLNSLLTGGGTDDQCARLAFGLQQLDHRVWVAGPDGREFSKTIRNLGVPFHPTPPDGHLKLGFILAAARFIRSECIQIVHSHHGRDIWPTVLAARLSGTRPKIVLTRHMAKSPSSWPSRRLILGQCDALIAVSHFVARVLREGVYEPHSPEPERRSRSPLRGDFRKIRVIHGGIDTDRFRPMIVPEIATLRNAWGLKPDYFAFACIGGYSLPRGKGQREFLQAAACIHQQVPNARFLIIGRGSMGDTLRADIDRLGLVGKAWLTPYCTDMPTAMNAIDCLVHPQIGTEALGLVVCEAHACGKPVIASELDGIPEAFAIGKQGRLVPPEDIAPLSNAMLSEAGRPRLDELTRAELHRRVAAKFSFKTSAEQVAELYLELLRSR